MHCAHCTLYGDWHLSHACIFIIYSSVLVLNWTDSPHAIFGLKKWTSNASAHYQHMIYGFCHMFKLQSILWIKLYENCDCKLLSCRAPYHAKTVLWFAIPYRSLHALSVSLCSRRRSHGCCSFNALNLWHRKEHFTHAHMPHVAQGKKWQILSEVSNEHTWIMETLLHYNNVKQWSLDCTKVFSIVHFYNYERDRRTDFTMVKSMPIYIVHSLCGIKKLCKSEENPTKNCAEKME